jgi:hypothetical protein
MLTPSFSLQAGYPIPQSSAMLHRLDEMGFWQASQSMNAKLVQVSLGAIRLFDEPIPMGTLPTGEVFLQPLLRGAFPADVPAQLLAFDPLIFFNLLLLGPKYISERVFSMS